MLIDEMKQPVKSPFHNEINRVSSLENIICVTSVLLLSGWKMLLPVRCPLLLNSLYLWMSFRLSASAVYGKHSTVS